MLRLIASVVLLAGCASASAPANTTPSTSRSSHGQASSQTSSAELELDEQLSALVIRLYMDEFEVRQAAARQLGEMGAKAAPALSELVRCAATEERDAGDDPGQLADREPVNECARAIASISAEDPAALVTALAIPLAEKQRVLAALARVGADAVPGAAALYVNACTRAQTSSDATVRRHLSTTADAAMVILSSHPDRAARVLGTADRCASDAAERLRTLALKQ